MPSGLNHQNECINWLMNDSSRSLWHHYCSLCGIYCCTYIIYIFFFSGHFLLTNLLLDTLNASSPSRVVTVASDSHWHGTIQFNDLKSDNGNCLKAYARSKLANVLFTRELAKRLEGILIYYIFMGLIQWNIHWGIYRSLGSSHKSYPSGLMVC